MREPENIRAVEETGANWMGFIFFPRSARYVTECPAYLPERCRRIGVFVNETTDIILQKAKEFELQAIQLHGKESPGQCRMLKEQGLEIIKVFSIKEAEDLKSTNAYEGICDYFLFDTACAGYGGSGKAFDWSILNNYQEKTPFLLSGGLSPGSVEALLQFHHPAWAGIDLNSGFEIAPALKDATLLNRFIEQIKQNIQ